MTDHNEWGPYPGDKLAPPPTPPAPEIPMSTSWPWLAGIAVALRYLIPLGVALVLAVVVLGFIVKWW